MILISLLTAIIILTIILNTSLFIMSIFGQKKMQVPTCRLFLLKIFHRYQPQHSAHPAQKLSNVPHFENPPVLLEFQGISVTGIAEHQLLQVHSEHLSQ